MIVGIYFPDEIESILRRRAAAAGEDIATFVMEFVAEHLANDKSTMTASVSPEEFAERSAAWIRLHPVLDHVIDDSRETFYGGRSD